MPRFDGTGPAGQGPMTGRGMGPCGGGQGPAGGYGRGFGPGRGRGLRWFQRWCPWARPDIEPDYPEKDQKNK